MTSPSVNQVEVKFISNENVHFCVNLENKSTAVGLKKSDDKSIDSSSKKLTNSAHSQRSLASVETPPAEKTRKSTRLSKIGTSTNSDTNELRVTPKRKNRQSKPSRNNSSRRISQDDRNNSKSPTSSPVSVDTPRTCKQSESKESVKISKCKRSILETNVESVTKKLRKSTSIKVKSDDTSTPTRKLISPSTPKRTCANQKPPRTPAIIKKKTNKKLCDMASEEESSEDPSSSDSESTDESFLHSSDDASDANSEEIENININKRVQFQNNDRLSPACGRISKLNQNVLRKRKIDDGDFHYDVDADDYFLSKSSKDPTSNNKLSSLEISQLGEDELRNLLQSEYIKHETSSDLLLAKYKIEFPKWLFYLKENFNLLMYGLGSKIDLLTFFHSEMISMHDVLTIHGYFPRLLVKDILNALLTDVLRINAPKNATEALPIINSALISRKSPVFLIVHNIDRLFLKQRKYQSVLCKLASFPNFHIIASVDHINAPLLWGNSMLTELNFVWINVITYQAYVSETSFENLIYLTETSNEFVSLSSLRNIIKPLASRVKKIFRIIVKERLDNANNKKYEGMSYDDWYHRAKEELLVNNITMFKVQLTELIDHGIIRMNDRQRIPVQVKVDVLEKFYKETYADEEE